MIEPLLLHPMGMIQITIPEEIPEGLSREFCLLAAVKLFELGCLSSARAAQLAGITRTEFLSRLVRCQVSQRC